jgi:hypothetical protein
MKEKNLFLKLTDVQTLKHILFNYMLVTCLCLCMTADRRHRFLCGPRLRILGRHPQPEAPTTQKGRQSQSEKPTTQIWSSSIARSTYNTNMVVIHSLKHLKHKQGRNPQSQEPRTQTRSSSTN